MSIRKLTVALLATVATGLAGAAYAADLYAPPPEAPVYVPEPAAWSWTGIYFGVNGGYGWGSAIDTSSGFGNDTFPAGWLAGGQIGANWQIGSLVLGVEGMYDWANLHDQMSGTVPFAYTVDTDISSLAAVRGRLGFAMDRILIYGTGGWAWASSERTFDFGPSFSDSQGLSGWTAGGGIEVALTNHITARVQYNYYDFGSATYNLIIPVDVSNTLSTVDLGINVKF